MKGGFDIRKMMDIGDEFIVERTGSGGGHTVGQANRGTRPIQLGGPLAQKEREPEWHVNFCKSFCGKMIWTQRASLVKRGL